MVEELLRGQPRAVAVFLAHRMACVGCAMAAFETLADAAAVYRLPLAAFLAEIDTATRQCNSSQDEETA